MAVGRSNNRHSFAIRATTGRIQVPFTPPADYDLSVTFEQRAGSGEFSIGFFLGAFNLASSSHPTARIAGSICAMVGPAIRLMSEPFRRLPPVVP